VEPGAEVRHSVIMGDVVIRAGATVGRSVLAENVVIGRGATVGAVNATHPALIGSRRRVPADEVVPAGTHLEPTRPRDLFPSTR
jgi:glucose-1-phosphate adenylyltransferase